MYVWLAFDTDKDLLNLKEKCRRIEEDLNVYDVKGTLPFHISLKISFEVDDELFSDIVSDITLYASKLHKSTVNTLSIRKEGNIVWLRMDESKYLTEIHNYLDKFFETKYNVPLNKLDKEYIFHTTLFINDDSELLNKAYELIKDESYLKTISLDKFTIGYSLDGSFASYRVFKEIDLLD